ncbi:ser/Thr protein phosphatase family protein [Xylariaceae sp. FL0016]|nr:ser/Thr protein phosphatase family protein [Xylariaceae sp. FL0016]
MGIKTRFLVISDTQGGVYPTLAGHKFDVVVHCVDLSGTGGSNVSEYEETIKLLQGLDAPLKLVIAGRRDFMPNTPPLLSRCNSQILGQAFNNILEANRVFDAASGITFLEEGTHTFTLANGARLTVYASPHKVSWNAEPTHTEDHSFQYHAAEGHSFDIPANGNVDVVMTHGPPAGILDSSRTAGHIGCPHLFKAIERSRPLLHCFGRVREGWGAKLVRWRFGPPLPLSTSTDSLQHDKDSSNTASASALISDTIDPIQTVDIDSLRRLLILPSMSRCVRTTKGARLHEIQRRGYSATSHCVGDIRPMAEGRHTLFVNAAMAGATTALPAQPPWVVDIELSRAEGSRTEEDSEWTAELSGVDTMSEPQSLPETPALDPEVMGIEVKMDDLSMELPAMSPQPYRVEEPKRTLTITEVTPFLPPT